MKQQIDWNSANIEDVVKGIGNKETEAYEEFFNRTVKKAYIIANKVLCDSGNNADAEDMVQDAYMTAFNSIGSLNDPNKAISWFGTIVGNKCRDYLKKEKALLFEEMDVGDVPFQDTIENENQEFIPEKAVDYSETKRLMNEIVDNLPKDQKLCTLLFYYNALSVKEIAEALDCSENTVKSRLNYSRKKIEDEVKALEKKGTKLYCIAPMPFIGWMLKDAEVALIVPEVLKTQVLSEIYKGVTVATSTATKDNVAKSVATRTASVGKTVVTKVVAGAVAAALAIGGGVFVAKSVREPTPTEIENEIISQLDYDYLEQLFCYLPIFDENDPVTGQEMYGLIYFSMDYLYQNIAYNMSLPTTLGSEDYIEMILGEEGNEESFDKTGYFWYIRVNGNQFDDLTRLVGFDEEINADFFTSFDPYGSMYAPTIKWDNGTIIKETGGYGSSFTDWKVEIIETKASNGMVEVSYKLSLVDYSTIPESRHISKRTAVFSLIEDRYVITKIYENEESTGAASISENYLKLY